MTSLFQVTGHTQDVPLGAEHISGRASQATPHEETPLCSEVTGPCLPRQIT